MHAYRAYMETLLNCSSDVQSYRLKTEGWHKYTYDKINEFEPNDNKGFLKREKYCAESPEVVLIGRPNMDVFHIDKLVSPGIDVAIKFMPNDDKFIFMTGDGDNLGPIKDINLIIATKQMSDATELAHRAYP